MKQERLLDVLIIAKRLNYYAFVAGRAPLSQVTAPDAEVKATRK